MYRKPFGKIPPNVLADAQIKLDELIKMLEPYLLVLKPEAKQTMLKAGEEPQKFIEHVHEFVVRCPNLFPGFMEEAIFKEEFSFAGKLWTFAKTIDRLKESMGDTEILAGDKVFRKALAFYDVMRIAARRDFPGAKLVFEELKLKFPSKRQRRKKAA